MKKLLFTILSALSISTFSFALASEPTVTASWTPSTITTGASATFAWSSTDATYCDISHPNGVNPWNSAPISYSVTYPNLTSADTTTVTCYNQAGQSVSKTVTLTVNPVVTVNTVPYSCPSGTVIQATISQTVAGYLAQCPNETPVLLPAVVISRYQGTKTSSDSNEGIVQVNIPVSAEGKTLVLAGYENINWIISNPNNVKVVKIIATNGEYSGTIRVTGAVSGIKVETHKVVPYPGGVGGDGTPFDQKSYAKFVSWLNTKGFSLVKEDFNGGGANTGEQIITPIIADSPDGNYKASAQFIPGYITSSYIDQRYISLGQIVEGEKFSFRIKGDNASRCTLARNGVTVPIQPTGPYTKETGLPYEFTSEVVSQSVNTVMKMSTSGFPHYFQNFTAVCYNAKNEPSVTANLSVDILAASFTPKEPTCPAGQRYDSKEYAKNGTNTCKPGKAFTCADGTVITVHDYAWSNESTKYFQCPVPPVIDKGVLIQTAPTFASSTDKTERVGKTNITIPRQAEGKALVLQTTGMVTTDGTNRYHLNNFIVSNPNNVKIKRIIIVENLCGDCGFNDGIIPTTVSGDISGVKVERWLKDAGIGGASEPLGKMFQYLRTDRLKYIPGLENEKYLDLRIRGISIDPLDVYTASEACLLPYVVANNPTPCAPTVYSNLWNASSYVPPKATTTATVVGRYQMGTYGFKMSAVFTEGINPQVDNHITDGQVITGPSVTPGQPFRVNILVDLYQSNSPKGYCTVEKDGVQVAKYNALQYHDPNGATSGKRASESVKAKYVSEPLYSKATFRVFCERFDQVATTLAELKSGTTHEVKYSRSVSITVPVVEAAPAPAAKATYKSTYNAGYGRETYFTLKNLTKEEALTRCKSNVDAINSFTSLNSTKPAPMCFWGDEQIYPARNNNTAVTVTNECTMTSVNWPSCAGVAEAHSVGSAGVGTSNVSTLPSGCTSSTLYSPTTGARCVSADIGTQGNSDYTNSPASDYQISSVSSSRPSTSKATKASYKQYYGTSLKQSRSKVTREQAVSLCNTRVAYYQDRAESGKTTNADVSKVRCTWGTEQIYPAVTVSLWLPTGEPAVLGASTSASCIDLPRNLHRGTESSSVSLLQSFLLEKGFLEGETTGFYGDKTVEAVKDYQASVGLPVTGMVYDFTRDAIRAESCR